MKNTYGNNFTITIFGESHGDKIGCVIDGLSAGIALDLDFIKQMMEKRRAKGKISTKRCEADEIHIVSGFFEGYTTGTPLTILIDNTNKNSSDYSKNKNRLRPSHADYSADMKYMGYQDYRGGGHFSGRITAALVAAGAIATQVLKQFHIEIGSHILTCANIYDDAFSDDTNLLTQQIHALNNKDFALINDEKAKLMLEKMEAIADDGDSIGGILESVILNVPCGLGEPFFDSIESKIAHILFSIPAVKGVSFGLGFDFSNRLGSEVNDSIIYDGQVKTTTNHNGGINGGISNGMPITIKTVIKATPSIYKKQQTIDKATKQACTLQIEGRHDPAIIHRARVVVDACLAIAILDLFLEHQATKSMRGEYQNVRKD